MGLLNSNFRKIELYLQDDIFYIPEYQRGYSWEENQLDDLWEDLIQIYNDEEIESHFLGQIVIHKNGKENKKKYIIDGQQRTSTIIILLDAFRSAFKTFQTQDAQYVVDDITSKFIGRYSSTTNELRLHLGKKDHDLFRDYIQSSEKITINNKKLTKSELRIIEAHKFFTNEIYNFIEAQPENKKFINLKSLYESLIREMVVMYIETDDINEAFIIFETLNARGKELETSDLLKNHVFRIGGPKINEIQNQWNIMIDNIGKDEPTKFIRYYWNSQNKFIREKDLYKSLRRKVTTPEIALSIVNELAILSEPYIAFNNPKENIYFSNSQLNEKIQEMHILSAKSYYPIILALISSDYDEKDILEVLTAIESLVVRNFVVAGKVANKYENLFARIAFDLSYGKLRDIEEIVKEIRKDIISDEEFNYSFSQFKVKKPAVIRYLLRSINNYFNSETRIINDNSKVHIEHILPKKPSSDWDIASDVHEEYLHRLGNLTLLGEEYNRSATNKGFILKKEIYASSQIKITHDLINHRSWTTEDIKKRQEYLAKIALSIWKK